MYLKLLNGKLKKDDMIFGIVVELDNENVEMVAMLDTGNMLKEPITNTPVIVAEHEMFRNVLGDEFVDNLENILKGEIDGALELVMEKYKKRIRVLPFKSVGQEAGLLIGLKVDKVSVKQNEGVKCLEDVIVALYSGKFEKRGKYQALIGLDIL